jgi:hypothetical protein
MLNLQAAIFDQYFPSLDIDIFPKALNQITMESHINPIVFENALPKLKHTNNTQKHSFSTTNKLDICIPFGIPDLKIPYELNRDCNTIIDFETFP